MPSARLKVVFGTLRARLTFWISIVAFLLVAAALVGAREQLRQLFVVRDNDFINEEMDEIEDEILDRGQQHFDEIRRDMNYKATDHSRRKLFIQFFSRSGELLWSSHRTPEGAWTGRLVGESGEFRVLGQHRVMHRALRDGSYIVRIGISTERSDNNLLLFTESMLAVGGIVVLIIPVVAFFLAGRATRPLSQIIDTATRLHPAHLNERLPVRGTHDELDRVSQTINGLLDRIARYLQRSREFNAHAAHELRTPLAAIQSSVEVTLLVDRTVEEYKEQLADLLEEFDRLRRLVNQLLFLAQGDAGQLGQVREPIRPHELVRRALEMFSAVAEFEGITLAAGTLEPITILADASALRQVINNLLDNAMKFTPPGGRVTVEVSGGAGECVLRVIDTGRGIAAVDLPRVFEPFYRAKETQESEIAPSGTGLGLSICRSIVEAYDGTISVESTPGQGAAFTIRLPLPADSGPPGR